MAATAMIQFIRRVSLIASAFLALSSIPIVFAKFTSEEVAFYTMASFLVPIMVGAALIVVWFLKSRGKAVGH